MTTYAGLKTAVARDLRDPDAKVFDATAIGDIINAALAEIGRIAPARFQEDIDLVENQFEYTPRLTEFGAAVPELELTRVELWDTTVTPNKPVSLVVPATQGYVNYSNTGWTLTEGVLELPYSTVKALGSSFADYLLRVWGYSPYVPLSDDADLSPLSNEREQALRTYCRVEALQRLLGERDLFTQWQTRPGNTDVSHASLNSALNSALDDWRRRSRAITVLRETAG